MFDPFLGSGTTLIACEQLGRACYGMEIEPRYVDVVVARFRAFVGSDEAIFLETEAGPVPYAEVVEQRNRASAGSDGGRNGGEMGEG